MHSDDEVTPRRGLEDLMTDSKILNLKELEGNVPPLDFNKKQETIIKDVISDGDMRENSIIKKQENSARILKNIGRGPKNQVDEFSNSSSMNILDSMRTGGEQSKRNQRYAEDS